MKLSKCNWTTYKDSSREADVISHQLMLRAGLIKRLASGLYTWLPFGLRILKKVEHIVRDEMQKIGAQELLMPMVQPSGLWLSSKRWDQFGPELLRIKDRHNRDFCLGPTHEEVICDIASQELKSYKDLPATYFQIQTKFRDEVRPRFGVIRSREFLMKDAYSFHEDQASLDDTYNAIRFAYEAILRRFELDFRIVLADSGAIGGSKSEEFHVLADSGEDLIAFHDDSDIASNIETVKLSSPELSRLPAKNLLTEVRTQDTTSVDAVAKKLDVSTKNILKTIVVKGINDSHVALLLRGDRSLNTTKAERLPGVFKPLTYLNSSKIQTILNVNPGYIGPIALNLILYGDHEIQNLSHFVCGSNKDHFHLKDVCWERDVTLPDLYDLRNAEDGDIALDYGSNTPIKTARGIEVGHIFQLGDKYTNEMNISVSGPEMKEIVPKMGCYGIGISRIVAAIIEQSNDDKGMLWPKSVAPFEIAILPIYSKDNKKKIDETGIAIYEKLRSLGRDVLYDDRDIRAGNKFTDSELLGLPLRLVISEKLIHQDMVEIKERKSGEVSLIPMNDLEGFIKKQF
jgi:prolyl-tRNA synthetase